MRRPLPFAAAALLAAAGCDVNTDPAIFVEAEVLNPYADVKLVALGAEINGGFTLSLHLGARAADSSQVSLGSFALVSEDEKTVIVDALPLTAKNGTFPIIVDPDTDEDVDIFIDYGNKTAEKAEGQKLCSFGRAKFRGSITDSLRGTSQPVLTAPVTVTGCTTM